MKKPLLSALAGICFGTVLALTMHSLREQPVENQFAPTTPQANSLKKAFLTRTNSSAPADLPWSRVESTNYAQYAANLRAVGCPEPTLAAIIGADLRQVLGPPRAVALFNRPDARRQRELQVLQVLHELGIGPVAQPGDFFLTAEQLRRVKDAILKCPVGSMNDPRYSELASQRRELYGSLTPEQEVYVKSEFERYGETVDMALAGFTPSQQEYYALVSAMAVNTEAALTNRLEQILSPGRYAEFMSTRTPKRVAAFRFAVEHSSARGKEGALAEILQKMPTLTVQEYRNQLRAILDRDTFDHFLAANPWAAGPAQAAVR